MKITRSENQWSVIGAERIMHESLETLALEKGYRVEEVSDELGISNRYLRSLFLRDVGLPPKEWMKRERMVVARRMLACEIDPLEVAESLGFSGANSFGRAFRETYGTSPVRYQGARCRHH